MKAAIYARVSLDEKSDDMRFQDPENQIVPLRKWADARGFEVVDVYVDKASGADAGRPAFNKLKDDARKGLFKVILIWKLDRFSRENLLNVLSYVKQLKGYGVGIISYTESWLDTTNDNPMSDLILSVMAWAASEERRKISERTKAGIARRRAIGQWRGGRPKKGGPT